MTFTLLHWLVVLVWLHVCVVDASISTAFSFPQDVFAKPAFKVRLGQATSQHTSLAPIKRSAALSILEQQSIPQHDRQLSPQSESSSLTVASRARLDSSSPNQAPLLWTLQRSSPTSLHLCSIPDFSAPGSKAPGNRNSTSISSRADLIQVAQRLLEPLKNRCLYHTVDWFTYSFCHGRDIRQFRLLTPQSAAADAHKKAGGGNKGDKAALDAAKRVAERKEPVADPIYPAFTLGRWRIENDDIVGESQSQARHPPQPLPSDETSMASVGSSSGSSGLGLGASEYAGTDLVEEVQFGDWDEEELVAAEAQVLASLEDSSHSSASSGSDGASNTGSKRHRYITQTWSDGTLCDVNNQPRTTEVQFHCSHRKQGDDRITLIKETTICNYVLIVETPRLCSEPAFGGEMEDLTHQLECHRIVDDAFPGLTLGDGASSRRIDDKAESVTQPQASSKQTAQAQKSADGESATSSHTYGDLSQYNSVYDDYYDEALGNHGPEFERIKKEHLEDLFGPDAAHTQPNERSGESLKESLFYVGMDDNGNLVVQSAEDTHDPAAQRVDGTSSSEKRAAAETLAEQDEDAVEIQLDLDDLLGVVTGGDDGGTLEKKIAQKIAQKLERIKALDDKARGKQKQDDSDSKAQDEDPFSKGLGKLYKQLMKAVDVTDTADAAKSTKNADDSLSKPSRKRADGSFAGKPGDSDTPANAAVKQRMVEKKVGDSLAERAQRFYDAREREPASDSGGKETGKKRPAGVRVEL